MHVHSCWGSRASSSRPSRAPPTASRHAAGLICGRRVGQPLRRRRLGLLERPRRRPRRAEHAVEGELRGDGRSRKAGQAQEGSAGEVAAPRQHRPAREVYDDKGREHEREGDVPAEGGQRPDVAHAGRVREAGREQAGGAGGGDQRAADARPAPAQAAPDHAELAPHEHDDGKAGGTVRPDHDARMPLAHPQRQHAGQKRPGEREAQRDEVEAPAHASSVRAGTAGGREQARATVRGMHTHAHTCWWRPLHAA